jgi:hypothetical protein
MPNLRTIDDAQWVPNYTLHCIGGGVTFRSLHEWYACHGIQYSKWLAAANSLSFHFWNEVIENGTDRGTNVDAIADLLIFNPLGILLFSHGGIAEFFRRHLHAADWSAMPVFDPFRGALENTAQNFSFKYFLPGLETWGLFAMTGMNTVLGLTHRLESGLGLSAGGGSGTVGLVEVDQEHGQRKMTAVLGWNFGGFVDRDGNLLGSILVSNQRLYRVRVNVYPLERVAVKGIRPGFFAAVGQNSACYVGVFVRNIPLGAGTRFGF